MSFSISNDSGVIIALHFKLFNLFILWVSSSACISILIHQRSWPFFAHYVTLCNDINSSKTSSVVWKNVPVAWRLNTVNKKRNFNYIILTKFRYFRILKKNRGKSILAKKQRARKLNTRNLITDENNTEMSNVLSQVVIGNCSFSVLENIVVMVLFSTS